MCGILTTVEPRNGARDLAPAMRAIAHRGPDDTGTQAFDAGAMRVTLGHQRLSIIDLSDRGHQPMATADGGATIVFNGEIYNFQQLRAGLESRGRAFRSRTDTEVLLHAYLEWGESCLERLAGMWAFVIWDPATQTMFGSRDRFGIKPLYYARGGGRFAVASEIKAITTLGVFSSAPNLPRVLDYMLFQLHDHTGETMFEGIHQLLPGHAFRYTPATGEFKQWKYWTAPESPDPSASWPDAVSRVKHALVQSVREHLVADVPVGFCLSGGIDSSAIVGIARAVRADAAPLIAFTAAYDDSPFDERKYVNEVVKSKGIEGYTVIPSPAQMERDLDRFILAQDEPPVHSSAYAQWCVMRLASEHGVKVLLDGQGADELFAGYPAHRDVLAADFVMAGEWEKVRRAGSPLRALYALAPASVKAALFRWRSDAWNALSGGVRDSLDAGALTGVFDSLQYRDLNRRLIKDTFELHLPKLLHYEDRNSMAFSIESRVPFLDHRVAEAAMSTPVEWRLSEHGSKWILRESVRDYLPPVIANRRDKIGFATPEPEWLAGLLDRRPDLLEDGWATRTLAAAGATARLKSRGTAAAWNVIWKIICLNIWHRTFFENGAHSAPSEIH